MAEHYDPSEYEDLGDKLIRQRDSDEIFCLYPLLSVTSNETETAGTKVFEYEPYTITVTYDIDGGKREKNAHWTRVYKEAGT
ncbi:MAG: hypothetical protein L6V87_02375 [Ruminococcus sp.]|nr:MAG: hypothetical protein L6V87_02375 [Ruminococcus sp.]